MIQTTSEHAESKVAQDPGEERRRRTSRALCFKVLSICWIFPSTGAVWILFANGAPWLRAATVREALQSVRFEQWIALGLLSLQFVFVLLALGFGRWEKARNEIVRVEKPRAEIDNGTSDSERK